MLCVVRFLTLVVLSFSCSVSILCALVLSSGGVVWHLIGAVDRCSGSVIRGILFVSGRGRLMYRLCVWVRLEVNIVLTAPIGLYGIAVVLSVVSYLVVGWSWKRRVSIGISVL